MGAHLAFHTRQAHVEVQLNNLEQLEHVRHRGGPGKDTSDWMRGFSEILRSPPEVEILRVDEMQTS